MPRKLLERTADLLGLIAGILLILMMLHITADVVLRYVFSYQSRDTIEIVSTYYMVAIVFLPLALVERLNAHIVVELFSQHLPPRVQELLIACICLLSGSYFAAFTWRTGQDAWQKYRVGEVMLGTTPITVWPTRFYLPIGCGLITLLLVYKAYRLFIGDTAMLARSKDFEAFD